MKKNKKTSPVTNFKGEVQNYSHSSCFPLKDIQIQFKISIKGRVKVLLLRMGKSQNWLAKKCGVTSGTMSKIVNGLWFPSSDIMVRMGQVLCCDSVILFGDSEYWKEYNKKIKYLEKKNE